VTNRAPTNASHNNIVMMLDNKGRITFERVITDGFNEAVLGVTEKHS
jgi:hypothetical protein